MNRSRFCFVLSLAFFAVFAAFVAHLSALPAFGAGKNIPGQQTTFAQKLVEGARLEASRKPFYRSAYYSGGRPPEDEGVCTDLIWRAFMHAGYDLKKNIDNDIRKNTSAYPRVASRPDPNIDFRRVPNQTVFFRRHAQTLTTKIAPKENLSQWRPGDIVVFANPDHIAVISDKRNSDGIPYIIHRPRPLRQRRRRQRRRRLHGLARPGRCRAFPVPRPLTAFLHVFTTRNALGCASWASHYIRRRHVSHTTRRRRASWRPRNAWHEGVTPSK